MSPTRTPASADTSRSTPFTTTVSRGVTLRTRGSAALVEAWSCSPIRRPAVISISRSISWRTPALAGLRSSDSCTWTCASARCQATSTASPGAQAITASRAARQASSGCGMRSMCSVGICDMADPHATLVVRWVVPWLRRGTLAHHCASRLPAALSRCRWLVIQGMAQAAAAASFRPRATAISCAWP